SRPAAPHLHGVGRGLPVRAMRPRPTTLVAAAVGAGGLAASALAATSGGMSGRDAGLLLLWAAGGAACAGVGAAALLRALRSPLIGTQAVVAALAPIVAVAVGIWGAAQAMFISNHDLRVLLVVLIGAGTVGVVTAL